MKGFSLVELLMSLAILSLLSLVTFSGYHNWYQNKVLNSTASEFIGALDLTKKLSMISGKKIYFCASVNHEECDPLWRGDLVIFTTHDAAKIETIIRTLPPIPQNITLHLNAFKKSALYFMNNGETANNLSFSLSYGKKILNFTLSPTGIVSPQI